MTHSLFMTDYGAVRVSYREARLIQLAEDIRRRPSLFSANPVANAVLAKADAIKAACVRFAEFTEGVRD